MIFTCWSLGILSLREGVLELVELVSSSAFKIISSKADPNQKQNIYYLRTITINSFSKIKKNIMKSFLCNWCSSALTASDDIYVVTLIIASLTETKSVSYKSMLFLTSQVLFFYFSAAQKQDKDPLKT